MPRIARLVVPGMAHHVTQRGNNRQEVFFVDDDRRLYLKVLKHRANESGLSVLAYCLMTNHVHLLVIPRDVHSLARGIGRTHWLYTQAIHRLHGRSGHLWQNRFFSCPLDRDHVLHAACYVERNPVRARLVRLPWRYPWSSAAAHVDGRDPSGVLDLARWTMIATPASWRKILQRPEDEEMIESLRSASHTGRPLASDRWLAKLEHHLGRRVRAYPVGRPPRPLNMKRTKAPRK